MKNNLITEEYVNSLSESELLNEQATWTAAQWQQYLCPNGTITIDEAFDYLTKITMEKWNKKYGNCPPSF